MKSLQKIPPRWTRQSPSMRREWIEICVMSRPANGLTRSPSMRREWIEMKTLDLNYQLLHVSLHAEGVD